MDYIHVTQHLCVPVGCCPRQLHNQIEDMKGQTRMYARVRPMDVLEKEAGCKEVCTVVTETVSQRDYTL